MARTKKNRILTKKEIQTLLWKLTGRVPDKGDTQDSVFTTLQTEIKKPPPPPGDGG
jgi:hypothetical protein